MPSWYSFWRSISRKPLSDQGFLHRSGPAMIFGWLPGQSSSSHFFFLGAFFFLSNIAPGAGTGTRLSLLILRCSFLDSFRNSRAAAFLILLIALLLGCSLYPFLPLFLRDACQNTTNEIAVFMSFTVTPRFAISRRICCPVFVLSITAALSTFLSFSAEAKTSCLIIFVAERHVIELVV